MAQNQTVTNEGITELVKVSSGGTATGAKSLVVLNKATTCTSAVTGTYTTPSDSATKHTDGGLLIGDGTVTQQTTNTTGDTIQVYKVFTATATRNAAGVLMCNDDDDVSLMECCFNAVIPMENTDTLTITAKIVYDQA